MMAGLRFPIVAVLIALSCGRLANSCSCFFQPVENFVCDDFTLVITGTGLESVPEVAPSPPPPGGDPGDIFFPSFVNDLVTGKWVDVDVDVDVYMVEPRLHIYFFLKGGPGGPAYVCLLCSAS